MKTEATEPAIDESLAETEKGNPARYPRLRAVTRRLSEVPALLEFASSEHPLYWSRGDRGCVGVGEVTRLVFRGPGRFLEASRVWREIARGAEVDDPVGMPGSGLVAFGTFAFDDASEVESVLVVPRLLINRHRGVAWVTEVTDLAAEGVLGGGGSTPISLPTPTEIGAWPGVLLRSPEEIVGDGPTGLGSAAEEGAAEEGVAEGGTQSSTIAKYLAGVDEAARRIDAGDVEKVVLARQIAGQIPADADLRVPLERLSARYLDCWTFAVDGLVGASPETLVRSTSGAVSARVLAGTRGRHPEDERRDRAARDELLRSAKEQHEHDFAVQSVISALSPHVNELRTSDEPFALQLPNVWHLATDLGASLGEGATALELVDALHPTAAVAGTPTAEAVALIAELEPFDRERYSGAVGWIDSEGDGEWVIALRCAQVGQARVVAPEGAVLEGAAHVGEAREAQAKAGEAKAGAALVGEGREVAPGAMRSVVATAGGGIVAGSDPQHELGETVSKFRPITEAFAK